MRTMTLALLLTACTGSETSAPPAPAPEPAAEEKKAIAPDSPEALAVPEGARVFFAEPTNGSFVDSPVAVVMGVAIFVAVFMPTMLFVATFSVIPKSTCQHNIEI